MLWLGNARTVGPYTMLDLSDREWVQNLREMYGDKFHVGPPQEAGGHTAAFWEHKGIDGVYLDE